MTKKLLSVLGTVVCLLALSNPAKAACGKVSITEMNWASSAFITEVSRFLMEQGYGCKVQKVPTASVTAATLLAETGKPDIATEMWYTSSPAYARIEKEGKVKTVANVFKDGGVEG